jgi:glucokinase
MRLEGRPHAMTELVIALDVGGTNTRARIAALDPDDGGAPAVRDMSTRVSRAADLYAFVREVIAAACEAGSVVQATVDVAGPVLNGRARLSNWAAADSVVRLPEFERAGLPVGRTAVVNDATAGAWGALARVDREVPAAGVDVLATPAGADCREARSGLGVGNLVYVAPGTGLSSAFIVRHGLGSVGASVVACEFENTQMPRFDDEGVPEVTDAVARSLGRAPDWEDLVSGRGLVNIYDALGVIGGAGVPVDAIERDARSIADAARENRSERALAASTVFYRVLGHFAQTLALSCLPCAAVVIGGASTERNLGVLREAGLVDVFRGHHRLTGLLGAVPLYAVGGEVNLEGGVLLGRREA